MKKLIIALLLALFSFPQFVNGQFYSLGTESGKIKWRQIETEHYKFIYPQEIDSLARRYASIMETKRPLVLESLDIDPCKIPVVLHPNTTISNGMVAWTPKRMEIFTTPPAYGGTPEPWDVSVALHETRHVGQTYHFTKGVYSVLYYLLGEQGTGIGVGIYPSKVSLEGGAVISETELSNAGRGRQAEFLQLPRAMYLNSDYRNWNKLRLGSFKYKSFDNYQFGYLLNTAVREYTSNYMYPSLFYRFLVKKWYSPQVLLLTYGSFADKTRMTFFEYSQSLMTNIWRDDYQKRGSFTNYDNVSAKSEKLYSEYRYSIFINEKDSPYYKSVIAVKSGMEHAHSLVAIDSLGKEHYIRPFNHNTSALIKSSDGCIYWTETVSHDAREMLDYSVLSSFNVMNRETRRYNSKTRYFNPAPSQNGDTIAVIEYPVKGSSFLVLLNAKDKKPLARVEAPQKGQLLEPIFCGNSIYCTIVLDKGLAIYKYKDGEWSEEIAQQNQTVKGLKEMNGNICFTSDLDGLQNIYQYDVTERILYRLTNSEYGATDPFYNHSDNHIYYSEFNEDGYHLAKADVGSMRWDEMDFSKPHKYPIAEMLTAQVKKSSKIKELPEVDVTDTEKYPSKRYSKLTHLFRFHAWAPVYYNVDRIKAMSYDQLYDIAAVGATFYSQNTLSTATTMLGYSYHKGFHSAHAKFTYSGFAPFIELSADFNDRYKEKYDIVPIIGGGAKVERFPMTGTNYFKSSVMAYYPITISSGGWHRGFIPQVSWNYSNDLYYSYQNNSYLDRNQLNFGIRYYQTLVTPTSCIFPKWGFGVSAMGGIPLGTAELFGSTAYLYGYLYTPGILRQQGIKLTASYQKQFIDDKFYYLSSYMTMPRGYTNLYATASTIKGTIDYAIPIYLGDISLGGLLYFKRMQLIPFADFVMDTNANGVGGKYYSAGADVLIDFNFLRFALPLSAGVRYARTGPQMGSQNYFHFIFNISLPN